MNNDDIENVIDFIFGAGYKEITTINDFLKKIKDKDKEIERLNNIIKEIKAQLDYLETYSSKEDVFEDMKRRLNNIEKIIDKENK